MKQIVEAYSRYIITDADGGEDPIIFTFQHETGLSRIDAYKNGAWLNPASAYTLTGNTIDLTNPLVAGDTLEIVRMTAPPAITTPPTPLSPLQMLFMVQEAVDKLVFMNGHGLPLQMGAVTPDVLPESSLLTNSFKISSNPDVFEELPTVQTLPDGRLDADPDGVNPGGFRKSALRFQHRASSELLPQSMSAAWFSAVVENPDDRDATSRNSYYAVKINSKGYQTAQGTTLAPLSQENCALDTVAETAADVTSGEALGVNASARHEAAQATLTVGEDSAALIFTANGGDPRARGEAGNRIHVKIMGDTADGSVNVTTDDPNPLDITIAIKPKMGETTADKVAAQINDDEEAGKLVLVSVESGGTGQVGTASLQPLFGGLDTDGKLVGVQSIAEPRGTDTGPGYALPDGGIKIPDDAYPSYAYTANGAGFYPGLAAIIAKGMDDVLNKGWYNAFVAHVKTKARLLWMPLHCAIEVPGFNLEQGPNQRFHNSMWMGLGTDEPEGTLHIRTAIPDLETNPTDTPETPEIILDNANAHDAIDNPNVARITMKGIGAGDAKEMVALKGVITNATDEHARLTIDTAHSGSIAARWHFAKGLWSEGLTDKGAGSINAGSYYLGGTKALYADAATPGAIKMRLGSPQADEIFEDTISGDGAIDFLASSMTVDTQGGDSTDNLDIINGGTVGDLLILRRAHANREVVVKNGAGNINCGSDRTLSSKRSTITLMCTANEGWVCISYQAN